VPDESETGLGLRVRPVVEMVVGNRCDDAQRSLHFVFEIFDEKISYNLCFVGIHQSLLFIDQFAILAGYRILAIFAIARGGVASVPVT